MAASSSGGSNVHRARSSATRSWASRNGTPSSTRLSAASVASSSGSAAASASRSWSNVSSRTRTDRAAAVDRDVLPCGEQRRLVLLEIAVVRQRQPLDDGQEAGQPTERGSRLRSYELGYVRIQLLRHHRRARGGGLREVDEAELRRSSRGTAPRRCGRGASGGARRRRGSRARNPGRRLRRASFVAGRRAAEAPAWSRRARPSRAATGVPGPARNVNRDEIALEHLDPREQVVSDRDGLCSLKMCVARHRRLGVLLGPREDGQCECANGLERFQRTHPPRRGEAPRRPGRCASGRRGSSCRRRRAGARLRSECPRRSAGGLPA